MGKDGGEIPATANRVTAMTYFAKQIVLKPDYELFVHPTSVREDSDDPVTITLRVRVGSDDQVDDEKPTNVLIDLAQYAKRFSDRFSIDYSQYSHDSEGRERGSGEDHLHSH